MTKIFLSPSDQPHNIYAAQNTNEQAQCYKIAEAAKTALERNGFQVYLPSFGYTHGINIALSNDWGANVHIPIHTNAGGGEGTEVFTYPASLNDKYVSAIYDSVSAITPGKARGIKPSTLAEITNTGAICVYLEAEFHDRADLAAWIVKNTTAIGEAIAKGCCAAEGKPYNNGGTPTPTPTPTPQPSEDFQGGKYNVMVDALNVRSAPNLRADVVATYTKDQTVVLDNWYTIADGYVWGRYTGATSGMKRYVAVGKATGKPENDDYLIKA